jgi:hypothetical protein
MTTESALQNILKGILHAEYENKHSLERIEIINSHQNNRQVIRE